MQTVLHMGAAAGLLGCFIAIVWASFVHFASGRDSFGMWVLRLLNVGATGGYLGWSATAAPAPVLSIAALGAVGLTLWLLALALRAVPRGTLDVAFTGEGPDRLIQSGIYGRIRHPLYTSYLIYWAGWAILTGGAAWALALTVVFTGFYWLAARQEEKVLTAKFGAAYAKYRGRAGRFWPKMGRTAPG